MAIIKFDSIRLKRNQCIVRNSPVFINSKHGEKQRFPCITLYEKSTGIPLLYPGYERWYLDIQEASGLRDVTLNKKANDIRSFLNYLLWQTEVNTISAVDIDVIRGFYEEFRETDDGDARAPDSWERGINTVARFLFQYHLHNSDCFEFHYDRGDLYKSDYRKKGGMAVNRFGVKRPKKKSRKGRFILEGYRDLILQECRRHDPMIRLGVALQSAAGIREGEVVNLTRSSIEIILGGYGMIEEITIDLKDEAPFAKKYKGKSEFGKIKVHRTQKVYTKFTNEIYSLYEEHIRLLDSLGADNSPDAPLFINKYGKPMSVETYKGRVKDVFQQHFVPDLAKLANATGNWAEHAPYLEIWTDHVDPRTGKKVKAEYPGAHMFRHWYTMYLLNNTSLKPKEISKWRGDESPDSMEDYIHINSQMIRTFRKIVGTFQTDIMEEVINREVM